MTRRSIAVAVAAALAVGFVWWSRRAPEPPAQAPAAPRPAPAPPPAREPGESTRLLARLDAPPAKTLEILDDLLKLDEALERGEGVDDLLARLGHANPRVRQLAALLLGSVRTPPVLAALAARLRAEPSDDVRLALVWALWTPGFADRSRKAGRREIWMDRLGQVAMGQGLPWSEAYEGQFDPKHLETTRPVPAGRIIPHIDADARLRRVDEPEARAALVEVLDGDAGSAVKHFAMRAMAGHWDSDEGAAALGRALGRERDAGLTARYLDLLRLNSGSEEAAAALLRYLETDAPPDRREKAVDALATKKSPAARLYFTGLYERGRTDEERKTGLRGLGWNRSPESLDLLLRASRQDPLPELRKMAVRRVVRYPDPGRLATLWAVASGDADAQVRAETLRAMGEQSCYAPGDVAALKRIAGEDPDAAVRAEAARWASSLPR